MFSIDSPDFTSPFVKQHLMGPNAVRILDELARGERLEKGMRVLDLGCGQGLTSIYLAQRFGAQVFAADLWIDPGDNYQRFRSLALDDRIIPLRAEARGLPFANEYFDAVVSVDAYHYFGSDDEYLPKYLLPLLKPGGRILIGIPGLQREFTAGIPAEMRPFWQEDMNFHSCVWWHALWSRVDAVRVGRCFELECLREAWADWLACPNPHAVTDIPMMQVENGKYFNLVGIKANRAG